MLKDVEGGTALSDALKKYPKIFNELYSSMIRVGETGGILSESLDRLVLLNSKDLAMRKALMSAMIYPAVLIVVAIFVLSIIVIKNHS